MTHFVQIVLIALLGCASPDELSIGYSHQFVGDSTMEGWPIENEDSDAVYLGLTWRLGPTRVLVENQVAAPDVRWDLVPVVEEPTEQDPPAPQAPKPEEDLPENVEEAIGFFDNLDWLTRVLLAVCVMWLAWVYRERLGRFIPGKKNNGAEKKS